ncbi:MAG: hypothetical protein KKE23_01585 [Nanoarchaeota archaeon]|nr:hypothetical protein [Nanoarchaeota archaeon]
MAKSISIYNNGSLSELIWDANEPLAFMDKNEEIYLCVADRILKEKFSDYGLELKFNFKDNTENWILYPQGKVMLLKSPIVNEYKRTYFMHDVRYLSPSDDGENRPAPIIEKACAGKDEIMKMIERSEKMEYYASAISDGRMILGRTALENFLVHFGLEFVLPNPVRLKGF